jgi:hypothetical protein
VLVDGAIGEEIDQLAVEVGMGEGNAIHAEQGHFEIGDKTVLQLHVRKIEGLSLPTVVLDGISRIVPPAEAGEAHEGLALLLTPNFLWNLE